MTENTKKQLGQEIKAIRLSKKLSLRKAAEIIGLNSNQTLSILRIERGEFETTALPQKFLEAIGYKFQEKYSYKILKANKKVILTSKSQ